MRYKNGKMKVSGIEGEGNADRQRESVTIDPVYLRNVFYQEI